MKYWSYQTLSVAGAILLVGCQGPSKLGTIPFHVAVVPVSVRVLPAEVGVDPDDQLLVCDAEAVSESLSLALREEVFTKVTLLSPPRDERGVSFADRTESGQQKHWITQAREQNADLLLIPKLRYSEVVDQELNEQFFLALPLFLLGGPFCYWVKDRTYNTQATMDVELFDLAHVEKRGQGLERESRLTEFAAAPSGVSLDFIDRAKWAQAGYYAVSFVLPAGLLAQRSDEVRNRLGPKLSEEICNDVVRMVRDRADDLIVADEIIPFFFNPNEVDVAVNGGKVTFQGDLIFHADDQISASLSTYEIVYGKQRVLGSFGDLQPQDDTSRSEVGSRYVRYPIEQQLALDQGSDSIRITVRESSGNELVRTYTFPVRRGDDEPVVLAKTRK
jgi:hypothetical protein